MKKKKKSSENDQLTGHFQSFFIYFFFVPSTLDLKKNPVNQLIKKIWPIALKILKLYFQKRWLKNVLKYVKLLHDNAHLHKGTNGTIFLEDD